MMKQMISGNLFGLLILAGCLCGEMSFAGSVTVSGTTGSHYTYIVIPEEYEGKEGQFVGITTSSNRTVTTYDEPYINGSHAYIHKYVVEYGAITNTLSSPQNLNNWNTTSMTIAALAKGSYSFTVTQRATTRTTTYTLYSNYWAPTEAQTLADLKYFAQNGNLPASPGITHNPTASYENPSYDIITDGLTIASAYIVVYGVDTGGNEEPTPDPGTGTGNGDINIDINIGTGTDDGVYALISSLFSYISDIQSILTASDEAIRSQLLGYISELQAAYQAADANMAITLQNQINALNSALSTNISDLRSTLESQIASLQGQLGSLQSQQNQLLADFYQLKTELQTAIQQNSGNITALSKELAEKYETLVASNSSLRAELLTEIAELTTGYKEADASLVADYTSKIAALQALLQQADATLADNISALESAYRTAAAHLKENLEQQLALLQNQMNNADRQLLDQITALEKAMSDADAALRQDYENKIASLGKELSTEAAALRKEMENLSNAYQTEIRYLKENLELQISNLKENTQAAADNLQKQINDLNATYSSQIAEMKAKYDAQIAALEAKSDAADAELKTAMEAYVKSLKEQMTAGDEEVRVELQAQLDNLSGAFNERLAVILEEYEDRIDKVKRQIAELESDTRTRLVTEKALLEQECRFVIENLNKTYAEKVAAVRELLYNDRDNAELYEAQIKTLETELASKIAETTLSHQTRIVEIDRQLRELSTKTASELLAELADLQNKYDIVQAAINSIDYADKLAALDAGYRDNAAEDKAGLAAKIAELEQQLAALVSLGELAMDDIIARIIAGDAANAEEHESLRIALMLYCDSLKDALGDRIAILEETISALQTALQQRMDTLENRLTYSLMTDEELAALEEAKQAAVNSLANQIAGLEVVIEQYRAEGREATLLEAQLKSLTAEYDAAVDDLANIRYVIELRSTSELALHRKWILELRELVASLQITINQQGETIGQQGEAIKDLQKTIADLEKALEDELQRLKDELMDYINGNLDDLNTEIADIFSQLETLRDNIVTLATSAYSGYHSSSTGNNQYNYSGTNKETLSDDRDLRTSGDTALDF